VQFLFTETSVVVLLGFCGWSLLLTPQKPSSRNCIAPKWCIHNSIYGYLLIRVRQKVYAQLASDYDKVWVIYVPVPQPIYISHEVDSKYSCL
jgi:hypothetical protein